jgi:DNA/RNA endonuclease YhcR with UshA esterase domain
MSKVNWIVGGITVLLIVLLTALPSRKDKDSLVYATANEITTSGTVDDVQEFFCPVSEDRGTHLVLKTDRGTMLVHVSIARFMRDHQLTLNRGDRLQVTGAKVRFQGKEGLIARQIIRGEEVFSFRDASGRPLWTN